MSTPAPPTLDLMSSSDDEDMDTAATPATPATPAPPPPSAASSDSDSPAEAKPAAPQGQKGKKRRKGKRVFRVGTRRSTRVVGRPNRFYPGKAGKPGVRRVLSDAACRRIMLVGGAMTSTRDARQRLAFMYQAFMTPIMEHAAVLCLLAKVQTVRPRDIGRAFCTAIHPQHGAGGDDHIPVALQHKQARARQARGRHLAAAAQGKRDRRRQEAEEVVAE